MAKKIRFSKRGGIILITALALISFGVGYTVWKITGVPNLAPVDSSAMQCIIGGEWVRCGWTCFPAGTKVKMDDGGEFNIEDIKVGDSVISQSEGGERSISIVTGLEQPIRDHMCSLVFDDGDSLELTAEHPVYTKEGWKSVDPVMTYEENPNLVVNKMKAGDFVLKYDGSYGEVVEIGCEDGDVKTYNLLLDSGAHTYFADGYLAHNKQDIPNEVWYENEHPELYEDWAEDDKCITVAGNPDQCQLDADGQPIPISGVDIDDLECEDTATNCGACDSSCQSGASLAWRCTVYMDQKEICEGCDPPDDPPPDDPLVNICDGGDILTQSDSFTIGDPITIVGWAFDVDGVNVTEIAVSVDDLFSGYATTSAGCPVRASSCDSGFDNVITWTYTFTSTTSAHSVAVEWKDSKGLTGSRCNASQTFSLQQVNPDWDMTKVAAGVCDETDPENIFIPVTYVVTVTNNSTVTKEISTVVDTLDTDVSEDWIDIDSISPAATISGNVITWNLTGDLASFEVDESKTFSYNINIPDDGFGTYINTVIATPADGSSSFSATETILAQCDVPIDQVPVTGIFDTTKGRLITGVLLILASIAYVYFDGVNYAVSNTFINVGKLFGYDSKVDRARKKFEKKW